MKIGQVRVNSAPGQVVPDGVLVFSYRPDGITVTEASIPAVEPASVLCTYVEENAQIQTGVALANPSDVDTNVTLTMFGARGEALGLTAVLTIPRDGHRAFFVREIPEFAMLPVDFRGVLRVTTDVAGGMSAIALKTRQNERGDFMIATIQVIDEAEPASSELLFPHFVDGGGYTTQFVLIGASPGLSAAGSVSFFTQLGDPLQLELPY